MAVSGIRGEFKKIWDGCPPEILVSNGSGGEAEKDVEKNEKWVGGHEREFGLFACIRHLEFVWH